MSDQSVSILTKKDWRSALLARRKRYVTSEKVCQKLSSRLIHELSVIGPHSVGAYWPIRSEPNVMQALLDWVRVEGGEIYLPETLEFEMVYRLWKPEGRLLKDRAGICFPDGPVASSPPQVILAPCVGYSEAGRRLGYGGGYFDRYLATCGNAKPLVIGVAYEALIVPESVFETHDAVLDLIVTESRTIGR